MRDLLTPLAGDGVTGLTDIPGPAAVRLLGVSGLAVSVDTATIGAELVWRTDTTAAALEDAQFELGQGPSVDAGTSGVLVAVPDLGPAGARWPMFALAAARLGVGAIFAFPLRIGAIRLGTLTAYRVEPGPLAVATVADAAALANAVTGLLLRPAGEPGDGEHRARVHQASGMISIQLGVPVAEALLRLRAHAYRHARPITDVADDVVARRLRFGGDP
jgi:hypothetical protein